MTQVLWLLVSALVCPAVAAQVPAARPPRAGELVVAEMMVNPEVVGDHAGEWVELCNVAAVPLELDGLVLRDDGRDWVELSTRQVVAPEECVVLARNGDPARNGGVAPDYVYGGYGFALSNFADEVIVEWQGLIIDEVAYDRREWAIPSGVSLELDRLCLHATINDNPGAWFPATRRLPGGDRGTPGR